MRKGGRGGDSIPTRHTGGICLTIIQGVQHTCVSVSVSVSESVSVRDGYIVWSVLYETIKLTYRRVEPFRGMHPPPVLLPSSRFPPESRMVERDLKKRKKERKKERKKATRVCVSNTTGSIQHTEHRTQQIAHRTQHTSNSTQQT